MKKAGSILTFLVAAIILFSIIVFASKPSPEVNPFNIVFFYITVKLGIKLWTNNFTCKAPKWKIMLFYIALWISCMLVASFIGVGLLKDQNITNWICAILIIISSMILKPSRFLKGKCI